MPTKPTLTTFLDKPSDINHPLVLFAAPLDVTTSNRRGTRFGPDTIRKESSHLDTYSVRTGLNWDNLTLGDIGDVECSNVVRCLANIENTIKEITGFPVMLGGEHTISLGAIRALKPELVVVFDAHLDLRDKLFGERFCHATYLRRAIEEVSCKVLVVGARALSKEEVTFANSSDKVAYITAREMLKNTETCIKRISRDISSVGQVYISIDLDDPVGYC